MSTCREILGNIYDSIVLGTKIKNADGIQVNPATEEKQLLKYPDIYHSAKITNASTSNTTITPGFDITKTTIMNNGTKEIIISLGVGTGGSGTDISVPAAFNLSVTHDSVSFVSYKGAESGGSFVLLLQGRGEVE